MQGTRAGGPALAAFRLNTQRTRIFASLSSAKSHGARATEIAFTYAVLRSRSPKAPGSRVSVSAYILEMRSGADEHLSFAIDTRARLGSLRAITRLTSAQTMTAGRAFGEGTTQ